MFSTLSVKEIMLANETRQNQEIMFAWFSWSLMVLSMLLMAAQAAVWQARYLKVSSRAYRFHLWITFNLLLSISAFILGGFFVVSTIWLLFAIGSLAGLLSERLPSVRRGSKPKYQKLHHIPHAFFTWIFVATAFAAIILFTIVFVSFASPSYQVWDRIAHRPSMEYAPHLISNAISLLYSIDGLAAHLNLHSFDRFHSAKCGEIFSRQLAPSERKAAIHDAFITRYSIDMHQFVHTDYNDYETVNEWFSRKIRPELRPIADAPAVSAADSRVIVFPLINPDSKLWLKNEAFSVGTLLDWHPVHKHFLDASAAIFRLAPQDYHRIHSPVSGQLIAQYKAQGTLMSVNAMAIRSGNGAIYNQRTISLIRADAPGTALDGTIVAVVAIGATCVGSVVTSHLPGQYIRKGDDIAHFLFGGSTAVVLFAPGAIEFDADLQSNSALNVETLVNQGSSIASKPINNVAQ